MTRALPPAGTSRDPGRGEGLAPRAPQDISGRKKLLTLMGPSSFPKYPGGPEGRGQRPLRRSSPVPVPAAEEAP
jgi:hypothetical protein